MAEAQTGLLYRLVCAALRADAAQGVRPGRSPDWACVQVLDAAAMPLGGGDFIELWLAAGARPSDVPRSVRVNGYRVELRVHAPARLRAHVAIGSNAGKNSGTGTIAALVRDRLHEERYYLLGCGHIFAGAPKASTGDLVKIQCGAVTLEGKLVDWEPVLVQGIPRTGIDAAIIRIDEASRHRLTGIPQASGIATTYRYDQEVFVQLATPNRGLLRARWSGFVDVPGAVAGGAYYYLENAVAYSMDQPLLPGDSGAAVWDADGRLLGIHVGAPTGNEQWRSSAVFCPIDRIMDWFDVEPVTSAEGAVLTEGFEQLATAPEPIRVAPLSNEELMIIAQTLWGEARGEGEMGMHAVANVIGRRVELKWQGKIGFAAICRAHRQFSCWNEGDPNRRKMDAVAKAPDAQFTMALALAQQLVNGTLEDITDGATHYIAASIRQTPDWARGEPPQRIGNQLFFKNIK